jgi:hypothetical protein
MDKFGFMVKKREDGSYTVSLPHQCDRWEIVGDENYYGKGLDQLAAMGEFAQFMSEASEAFLALSRGEEFGADE